MRTWNTAIGLGVAVVCGWSAWANGDLFPCANQDYGGRDMAPVREVRPLVGRPETAPAGTNLRVVAEEGDRLTSNTCATAHPVTFDLNARYEDIVTASGLSFTCPNYDDPPSCNPSVQCSCTWYKFVAVYPHVLVTTCEAQIMPAQGGPELPDPAIALYRATDPNSPCDSLVEMACNDDFGCLVSAYGPPYDGLGASLAFYQLTFGTTYYVQVCFTAWCSGGGTDCHYAEGDYRLRIYHKSLCLCAVVCVPEARPENEPEPCAPGAGRINEGCDTPFGETPRFSPISCNQIVCGSSFRSPVDFSDMDRDWYRLVLPPGGPYTINWKVSAEFYLTYSIIPAGTGPYGCEDLPAPLDSVSDYWFNDFPEPATATVEGGVYYLTVTPDAFAAPCGARYEATLTTAGCVPPACRGDVNCDGVRTFKDIDAFVARLGCPATNTTACVAPAGCTWEQADMNADGIVNFKDISGFVAQLGIACP